MKFGSCERVNNYENINFFPGPGHYDARTAFKQSRTVPKAGRPIPKTAFNQTSNRFDGALKNETDLGPGYYFGQKEWQTKKLYKENKAQFYPNPRKIITIPSIPSSTHAMGYVEREDGYLIPLNGSTVKDEHDMGPGVYDANEVFVKKKVQGIAFNRMTSPRFAVEKSPEDQRHRITLGNYTLPKPEVPEVEPEPKVKEPPKKVLSPEEEARRLQERLEENPGLSPGYYHNEKLVSSFKVQTKSPEFQNFGTTSKRFVTSVTGKPSPGPGFYNVPLGQSAQKAPYIKVEPYSKGDQRFKSAIFEENPGPGSYTANYDSNTEVNWTSQTGFPSAFGSGVTRFIAPKSAPSDQPGPGSYNPFKASKKNKKKKNKPAISSMMHSSTPLSAVTPNFSRDLGYAPDMDLGGRSKGAVIVKHEEPINKGTSAFQSVGQRFAQDKDKRSMTPGPGSYDWKQKKLAVKPSHNTLKTTFSLTPRGNETKGETYKKMLGPGVYDYSLDPVRPNINYAPKINPIVPVYGALLPK